MGLAEGVPLGICVKRSYQNIRPQTSSTLPIVQSLGMVFLYFESQPVCLHRAPSTGGSPMEQANRHCFRLNRGPVIKCFLATGIFPRDNIPDQTLTVSLISPRWSRVEFAWSVNQNGRFAMLVAVRQHCSPDRYHK